MTSGTLIIWSLSRSDNGIRMSCSDGFVWSRDPAWTASGMDTGRDWLKILGDIDCYYYINHMTCSIHIHYCSFIFVTLSTILFTIMSHVYFTFSIFSIDTLFMYTDTLHSMYSLFHVFSVDTLLLYNLNTIVWLFCVLHV